MTATASADECAYGVADLHVDLPLQVRWEGRPRDLSMPGGSVTAESLRAGCVRTMVLSLFLPPRVRHTVDEQIAQLETAEGIVRANPGVFGPEGVTPIYATEGSQALAGHLDRIPELVARGVRLFGVVHNRHNDLADSATDTAAGRGGLTPEGERFVRAVYAAGALVDVSHASDEAFDGVARIARELGRPIVATHSNARALAHHPRNLTDEQLRAVAASGGIVGLNFHASFLRRDEAPATIDDVVRHAAHLGRVMSPANVALGSDLDGHIRPAVGLETHAGVPDLVRALCRAGIQGEALRGLLGDNVRRVLQARP